MLTGGKEPSLFSPISKINFVRAGDQSVTDQRPNTNTITVQNAFPDEGQQIVVAANEDELDSDAEQSAVQDSKESAPVVFAGRRPMLVLPPPTAAD
jgi:hypothetical protein